MTNFDFVSVHGGHSGSFCGHASDSLEAVVKRYIELGFRWVCLTEHMPAEVPELSAPEEAAAGMTIAEQQLRFDAYFAEGRRLQQYYQDQIILLIGFETDAYTGYETAVSNLIARHQPDMLVGSVHHVHDLLFDDKLADYTKAARLSGGINALYCDYFDKQLALIERFKPTVVGHFDLIRIHDPDYTTRWQVPEIRERAIRNLDRIKALDLILDLNVRALAKGASEPYIAEPWMNYAIANDIKMATGDDSHGVASVGANLEQGVAVLQARGGHTNWPMPAKMRY